MNFQFRSNSKTNFIVSFVHIKCEPCILIGKRTKDVTINNNEAIHDII